VGTTAPASEPDKSLIGSLSQATKQAGQGIARAAEKLIDVEGRISIALGKFLYFEDVVIRSVGEAFDIILGPDGRPQKCTVSVTFVTRLTPLAGDVDRMYNSDASFYPKMPGRPY
jgi:hypothetical protein